MLFNSLHFLMFFPIIILLYFAFKHRHRWIILLLSSYYFYMSWRAEYVILLAISTLTNYFAALGIDKSNSRKAKNIFLVFSLATNLGLLFAFKYFNFFSDSIREILAQFAIPLNPITLKVLLPIGISFYTFQSIGYTIDVYRGKIKPEKHLGIFAVYVSFFPQLVAGPIERAKNLLPQFFEKHNFNYAQTVDGLKLMLWGFFKKLVIADRLAVFVDMVFNNVGDFTGVHFIFATVLFAFQIYCDFSGYSDIAIGAAQVMGFRLMDNFNRPYISRSVSEFWKRWHISLSTWFRDYLYIPLGGNKVSIFRNHINIIIVFLLSGLWHGAGWTFVIWGLLHGFYLLIHKATTKIRQSILRFIRIDRLPAIHKITDIIITFTLVNIAWVFFRADTLKDAMIILKSIFSMSTITAFIPTVQTILVEWNRPHLTLGLGMYQLYVAIAAIVFMEIIHYMQGHASIRHLLANKPSWIKWSMYMIIILAILYFGQFGENPFIYFQF